MSKIECALHTPYDVAHAQKDYEQILMSLSQIHRNLNSKDVLNVGPSDKLVLDKKHIKNDDNDKGKITTQLKVFYSNAINEKTSIESKFEKLAASAAAAAKKAQEDE